MRQAWEWYSGYCLTVLGRQGSCFIEQSQVDMGVLSMNYNLAMYMRRKDETDTKAVFWDKHKRFAIWERVYGTV
jgi:hypothetical protein